MRGYFDHCRTLAELKLAYKRLALENHPDRGGDTRVMQDINAVYDAAFKRLKDMQNAQAAEEPDKVKPTTEEPEEFREILNILLNLEGLQVELCGSWLWISGDTRPHKDTLKANHCLWSGSKQMWYWRHPEKGCYWSRGHQTMSQIRDRYGSETFEQHKHDKIGA